MKNITKYLVAGMIGLGSLGVFEDTRGQKNFKFKTLIEMSDDNGDSIFDKYTFFQFSDSIKKEIYLENAHSDCPPTFMYSYSLIPILNHPNFSSELESGRGGICYQENLISNKGNNPKVILSYSNFKNLSKYITKNPSKFPPSPTEINFDQLLSDLEKRYKRKWWKLSFN